MNRKNLSWLPLICCVAGCSGELTDLEVVQEVELDRYVGRWYEIASYPAVFQQNCVGTTADYSLNEDGTVAVVNTCYDGSFDADLRTAQGTARVVDDTSNAKLKVRFFIFEGDYWILELGDEDDYGYAVVGTPDRQFLWILSRSPQLDEALLDDILSRLPDLQFDPERLQWTPQLEE